MSWRKINFGRAENDAGTCVTRTGYKSMKYERGGREIVIDVEAGDSDLGIYARSIKRWQPSGEPITPDERAAIVEDLKGALEVLEVPYAILWK